MARHELETAGPAKKIKLTPIVGPPGFRADGADIAPFDVEIVDEKGRRCPTEGVRIDFTTMGPAVWRGGYNSGKTGSTNNSYLNVEYGINRVAVRSTWLPGTVTREGLEKAAMTVEAKPVTVKDGLADRQPSQ